MAGVPPAPGDLGDAGGALWASVAEWAGDDLELRPDDLAILREACDTRDLIASLAAVAASSEPVTTGSRGQAVVSPAIQELRQQRQLLAALLRQLGLPDPESGWEALTSSQRGRKAARSRWDS